MSFDFFYNFVSLLMQIVLNHMRMCGVSPLVDNNVVAFYMHMLMAAAQAAV